MIVWMVLDTINRSYYRIKEIHGVLCFQKFYSMTNEWSTWSNSGKLKDFCVDDADELVIEMRDE